MYENVFKKYFLYEKEDGDFGVNQNAFSLADEAFSLFKELYNTEYGSIEEEDSLISIHTGGWSENESLISDFRQTAWWFKNHRITAKGGHYYFNTDIHADKDWVIRPE